MLAYNARRIVFEPEFILPSYRLADLYKKEDETLLNKKGQFFVQVTEKHPYIKELVRQAQDAGLTVSGDGSAPVKGGDIREAKKGDQITFGSSSRFDVNWTKRDQYFCQQGHAPVYDIVKDWNKIEKAIKQFAEAKKTVKLSNGDNIRFHSRFMMVDGRCVPYRKNEILVVMPEETLYDILYLYDITAVKVVRTW